MPKSIIHEALFTFSFFLGGGKVLGSVNRSGVGWLWKVLKEGHRRAGWDIRFPCKEISCEEGREGETEI